MKAIVEAIQELTSVIKENKQLNGNCELYKCLSIDTRLRLMEVAYHEDMKEVYQRLAKLEAKCLNL
jgi:hypothetical protein